MNLMELNKIYVVLESKYKLPSYSELNENFEIEKIRKGQETLLRTIRKVMMEKIVNSLGFTEILLNPINAPRMYFIYLKSMTANDKKEIEKIYSSLSELAISSMSLEINYSESGEAEMIKEIAKEWNLLKPSFNKIIKDMQNPVSSVPKEKTYFG